MDVITILEWVPIVVPIATIAGMIVWLLVLLAMETIASHRYRKRRRPQ